MRLNSVMSLPRCEVVRGLWSRVRQGAVFFLREPKNVIELRYVLRGSPAQVEEGREILSSLEIRTGGIEYPQPLRDGL